MELLSGFAGTLKSIEHDFSKYNFIVTGAYVVVEGTTRGSMTNGKSWEAGKTPGGRFLQRLRVSRQPHCAGARLSGPRLRERRRTRDFRWGREGADLVTTEKQSSTREGTMTDVRTYQYFLERQMVGRRGVAQPSTSSSHIAAKSWARAAPNLRRHRSTQGHPGLRIKAFPGWADSSPAQRATLFFKAAEIVKRRRVRDRRHPRARNGKHGLIRDVPTGSGDRKSRNRRAGWVYNTRGEVFPSNIPGSHSFSIRRSAGSRRKLHALERSEHTVVARGAVCLWWRATRS